MSRHDRILALGFIAALLLVLLYAGLRSSYVRGIQEGRRQMTAEYAAEFQRLDKASRPEEIRAWLKGKGK